MHPGTNLHNLDSGAITSLHSAQPWSSHQMNDCPYLGGICSNRKLNRQAVHLKAPRVTFRATGETAFSARSNLLSTLLVPGFSQTFHLSLPSTLGQTPGLFILTSGMVFLMLTVAIEEAATHTRLSSLSNYWTRPGPCNLLWAVSPQAFSNRCTKPSKFITLILIDLF